MTPVSDNELILFHYRDGLDRERLEEIEAEMITSAALRRRHERLCELLDGVRADGLEPPPGFEQRLWAGFDARMGIASMPQCSGNADRIRSAMAILFPPRLLWAGGIAAAFACVLAIGFLAGRGTQLQPQIAATVPLDRPSLQARVLDTYVAAHLRATEGVLLTAVNDDSGFLRDGNRELATELVASNRLYAAAAARAGNARLADFLRQLEPVLIGLANQSVPGSVEDVQGLRQFLRDTDLLFQVRATESRIDADSKRSL